MPRARISLHHPAGAAAGRPPSEDARPRRLTARPHRIIRAKADIREGVDHLLRVCPVMARVHAETGDPPLRRRAGGFGGLVSIVAAQQLSAASAAAIMRRLEALTQGGDAAAFAALSDEALRQAGLSAPKIATLRNLARAILAAEVDLVALDNASDEDIHRVITSLRGFGPWSADIYLMFCLGRADAFAPGDLALQIAVGRAFGLPGRPAADETETIAARWRPWRGVAARLLWAYYARKSVPPVIATPPPKARRRKASQ